jgi:hypothetical protein
LTPEVERLASEIRVDDDDMVNIDGTIIVDIE